MPSAKRNAGSFNLLSPSLFSLLPVFLLYWRKHSTTKTILMVSSFNVLGTFQRRTHQTLSKPCQGKHDHVRDEMPELERRGRGKGVGGANQRRRGTGGGNSSHRTWDSYLGSTLHAWDILSLPKSRPLPELLKQNLWGRDPNSIAFKGSRVIPL